MRRLFAIIFSFVFALSLMAQNVKRPDSYNYTRGVEALQNENTEEALDYFNKEIHQCPVKMGRVKQLIKKPRNQGII